MQIHLFRPVLLLCSSTVMVFAGCGSPPKAEPMAATKPIVPMVMASPATVATMEPVVLKFTEKSIKAIQAQTKTATIRKGVRPYPSTVRAVGAAGDVVMLSDVTTTPKKLSELTEDDAKANGSASLEELKTQLAKDYPGIKAEDMVTVVAFKLAHA